MITTEGLHITILNLWCYVMHDIIPKLQHPILGPDKIITSFENNKQIGSGVQ